MTSVFEADTVLATIQATYETEQEKNKFETEWKDHVQTRVAGWMSARRGKQSMSNAQLTFNANVVEYVNFVHKLTKVRVGGSRPLPKEIPLLGPRFLPPTYFHVTRRESFPQIKLETAYLLPLTVIHPFYFPELKVCPQCGSKDASWDSWGNSGHREVHGICREECAIGFQLRCGRCAEKKGPDGKTIRHCFSTTSKQFWDNYKFDLIPGEIPIFFHQRGFTRELFDLIIEIRPSSTLCGLERNIKQLHLREYKKNLKRYEAACASPASSNFPILEIFSEQDDEAGYADRSITDEMISDVYREYSKRIREGEMPEVTHG
ncbi:hypothetical protein C8Q75DRAFT_780754 [Abortiporus biennis]|nr:hypothetical protein C8Q75DRAFT_780754 [Abortiporus biennis]